MISIHTNLSSLAVQNNLAQSTKGINTAIERMSTGYKINHAGDNAANYSISQNMNAQLSACDIAADNISMGMDLLSVAQDTIAGMQDRGSRIHALITQARNGTYGADSLNAMSQEAQALVSEINRLYVNTEYNGIKLFDNIQLPDWAQEVKNTAGKIDGKSLEECAAEHNGFIAEVVCDTPDITVTDPDELADAISSNTKIGIGNAKTLAKLAELVNDGNDCSGKTIILTDDIDLSGYTADGGWNPIGYWNSNDDKMAFAGTFNGNGHKITNLYINRPDAGYQGLFGYTSGEIKNVGVEGDVKCGMISGILIGCKTYGGDVNNCYATGNLVSSAHSNGLLIGSNRASVENCYTIGDIKAENNMVGGLIGSSAGGLISKCYAEANVKGKSYVGGGLGDTSGNVNIDNCYATGNVEGKSDRVGGFVGCSFSAKYTNCYATGNVKSEGNKVGGFYGDKSDYTPCSNCYSTGDVRGVSYVGGFCGSGTDYSLALGLNSCFSTGAASGSGDNIDDFSPLSLVYEYGGNTWEAPNAEAIKHNDTTLQVGTHSGEDSQITVDTNLNFNLSIHNLTSDSAFDSITNFLNKLSSKATELGAAQNRLESALESNMVQMDNLTSSLSTIRDADISEVSSDFIRQQILQQAAATLLSTANQSPAIALQLI